MTPQTRKAARQRGRAGGRQLQERRGGGRRGGNKATPVRGAQRRVRVAAPAASATEELHACDVATDYALHYAISRGVEHIFSVPCCQHEVNKTIQKGGDFDILLSHGLFQERFSALLTDAIRAAVLEDEGYDVDVIEFIDFAHSPKNLMLRCHRTTRRGTKKLAESRRLQDQYGFEQTLLSLVQKDET